MKKYILEKSRENEGWWTLTDTENLVVIRFKEHEYNETQKVSILEESELMQNSDCANKLAHIMSEMGDYMSTRWYSIAMPTPVYEIRIDDEQDKQFILRHKFPKFSVEIQDECDVNDLAKALAKAGEFLKKRYGRE